MENHVKVRANALCKSKESLKYHTFIGMCSLFFLLDPQIFFSGLEKKIARSFLSLLNLPLNEFLQSEINQKLLSVQKSLA